MDEVAADHVQADCIIHFGPACLTQYVINGWHALFDRLHYILVFQCVVPRTRSLPVLYVFGHEGVNTPECVEAFRHLFQDRTTHILVMYDTVYAHCMGENGIATYVVSPLHFCMKEGREGYIHHCYHQTSSIYR